jgi:hypothetical protein
MDWTVQDSNLHRDRKFFSLPKCPDWLWGPPSLPFKGYWSSLLGVKRPRREVKHSPPTSAEVKYEWNYTSTPPTCHYGVGTQDFTFLPLYWYGKSKISNFLNTLLYGILSRAPTIIPTVCFVK